MAKGAQTLSLETGMLAFARSVQITEGLFYASRSSEPTVRTPIEVLEKGVRGQSSEDKAKNPGLSNPQSVEYAIIPQQHDGVDLAFSITFLPLSLSPHACNNLDVTKSYQRLAAAYHKAGGYQLLALRYLWNIANARFAWRNRFHSDVMQVRIGVPGGLEFVFDPFQLELNTPATLAQLQSSLLSGPGERLADVVSAIAFGLSNSTNGSCKLRVSWTAEMEPGQEIFPSQEYVRDERKDEQLSRVYAKLPTWSAGRMIGQASMHSQKIGAALRHIDTWYGEDDAQPISVNPYGGIQETSEVKRDVKSKLNFYDLRAKAEVLINGLESAQTPDQISGDAHFVMANLVRGGVFGSSNKKAEANG